MIRVSRSQRISTSWRGCPDRRILAHGSVRLYTAINREITDKSNSFVPIPQTSIPSIYDHPFKRLNSRSVFQGAFFPNAQAHQSKSSRGDFVTGARLLERLQEVEEQTFSIKVFVPKRQGIEELIAGFDLAKEDSRVNRIKTCIDNEQSITQVISLLEEIGEDSKMVIFRLIYQAEASQLPFVAQLLPVYWKSEYAHMTYKNAYQSTVLTLESFMDRGKETRFSSITYEKYKSYQAAETKTKSPEFIADSTTTELKTEDEGVHACFKTSAERRALRESRTDKSHLTEEIFTRPIVAESAESLSTQFSLEKLVQELKTQYFHSYKENGLLNDRLFGAISKSGSFPRASQSIEKYINEDSSLPSSDSIEIYLDTLKRFLETKKAIYIGDNFDTYALHKIARLGPIFKSKHITPAVVKFMLPYIGDADSLASIMTTIRGSWNRAAILNQCQEELLDTSVRCSNNSVYTDPVESSFRDTLVMSRMFIIAEELESLPETKPSLNFLTKLIDYNISYSNISGIIKCLDMVSSNYGPGVGLDLNRAFEKFPLNVDQGVGNEKKSLWLFSNSQDDKTSQMFVITKLKQHVNPDDRLAQEAADEALKRCQV
ncbi:hypothetical protein NADFUDRAFT_83808 [Nadsonia fulvescens var. elongata DSM 6958]|uniref:ATPase expression protein 1 n=1 Tax=Nadsonia fulvescens var. elongata DSM 6958 TaxID=857566 RepID=A0A1E3PFX0_9ASCO|nr:hypothetical protein NADFUDRAFT_83808 [Nadsonia fulvescens var. elongata DSM 6958]